MAISLTVYLWILIPLTVFVALVLSIVLAGRRFNGAVFRSSDAPATSRRGLFVNVVPPTDRPAAAPSGK
ncbi:hypothetical protein ABZ914_12315 [Spirillospora sp. NPDC046719]